LYTFFSCSHTATTEIYTLSLHDALPISNNKDWFVEYTMTRVSAGNQSGIECSSGSFNQSQRVPVFAAQTQDETSTIVIKATGQKDRKSTRLNSSHLVISYAVFCLKKKKK